jgi:ketosteroid isomerase-like protein
MTAPDILPNKRVVERYMEGFRRGDHAMVLSCLTDDVEWLIPGMFHVRGAAAFDKEIENEAFVGHPEIAVTRFVEEGDVVVAEGTARARKRGGGDLHLMFCDVFTMREGKVSRLVSYLMEPTPPPRGEVR